MSDENKPKTARSYRATVVGDNTVVSINLKWAGQVLVLVAGLVYSYLQVENRIRELERRVELSDTNIEELVSKHMIKEEKERAERLQKEHEERLKAEEERLRLEAMSRPNRKEKTIASVKVDEVEPTPESYTPLGVMAAIVIGVILLLRRKA